jgi:hypothetical protein
MRSFRGLLRLGSNPDLSVARRMRASARIDEFSDAFAPEDHKAERDNGVNQALLLRGMQKSGGLARIFRRHRYVRSVLDALTPAGAQPLQALVFGPPPRFGL